MLVRMICARVIGVGEEIIHCVDECRAGGDGEPKEVFTVNAIVCLLRDACASSA